jgi:hypothetical protein
MANRVLCPPKPGVNATPWPQPPARPRGSPATSRLRS